jgi:hypothetical protein
MLEELSLTREVVIFDNALVGLSVDTQASQRSLPLTIAFMAASTADLIKAMNFSTAPDVMGCEGVGCAACALGRTVGVSHLRAALHACPPNCLQSLAERPTSHPTLCGKHHAHTTIPFVAAGSAWVAWWLSPWRQTTATLCAQWCRVSSSDQYWAAAASWPGCRATAAAQCSMAGMAVVTTRSVPLPCLSPPPRPPAVASTYGGSQAPQPASGIAAAVGTLQAQQAQGAVDLGLLFPNGVNDTGALPIEPLLKELPACGMRNRRLSDAADLLHCTVADSLLVLQGTATPSAIT